MRLTHKTASASWMVLVVVTLASQACEAPGADGGSSTGGTSSGGASSSSGTGGGSSSTGSGGGGADYEAWCPAYRSSWCAVAERCGLYPSAEACRNLLESLVSCVASPGMRDGRTVLDATSAAACLAELSSGQGCDEIDTSSCFPGAVRGTGGVNAACYGYLDCAPDLYCDVNSTCPGTCRAATPAGQRATPGVPCVSGTAVYDSFCTPLVVAGQPCAPTGGETRDRLCAAGHFCSSTKVCTPRRPAGQACTPGTFTLECAGVLSCHDGTCSGLGPVGSMCSATEQCQTGLLCNGTICEASPMGGLNAPCSTSSPRCELGLACQAPAGMTNGTCQVPTAGKACVSQTDCGSTTGLYCAVLSGMTMGTCAPRKAVGAPCASALECITVVCTGGACGGCVDPTP